MSNLIGRRAQATCNLVPTERGEVVVFDEGGGTDTYFAYTKHPIAKGSPVRILDELPGKTVVVDDGLYHPPTTPPPSKKPGTSLMENHEH